MDVVISTATAISSGSGGGDVRAVDDAGHGHLIDACKTQGVQQFVFVSFPPGPLDDRVLLSRSW